MVRRGWANLKKYQFLVLLLAAGVCFLSYTHNWKVYRDPMKEIGRIIWKAFGIDLALLDEIFPEIPEDPEEEWYMEVTPEDSGNEPVEEAPQAEIAEEIPEEPEGPKEIPWMTVENDYFEDALFIGDSRTVGLRDYGKMGDGVTFYASTGLTIYKLFTAEIVETEGIRKKINIEEALGQRQFRKIYLCVGINELGTGTVERFERTYREALEKIRELQPDAILYIQSILRVTKERSEKGDYITNEEIDARNEAISKLADNETIFWLDGNEAICDESGGMNPEYTSDGVHLKVKYIPVWRDFIKSHAIEW